MTLPASFYRAEAAYLDPPDEEFCPDCGNIPCSCDDDAYGDAWENGLREERELD